VLSSRRPPFSGRCADNGTARANVPARLSNDLAGGHSLDADVGILAERRRIGPADDLPFAAFIGQAVPDLKISAERGVWLRQLQGSRARASSWTVA
jgi:hypothetical protein